MATFYILLSQKWLQKFINGRKLNYINKLLFQTLKKLRRRTWSAPNRNMSRLSLALPSSRTESLSHLQGIGEESSQLSFLSSKSEDDTCLGDDSGET